MTPGEYTVPRDVTSYPQPQFSVPTGRVVSSDAALARRGPRIPPCNR